MALFSHLPYWAEKYVLHIREFRPKMYKELKASGELEPLALSIQESADSTYDNLISSYKAQGMSESSAEAYADGDVMRQFILLPSERDVPVLGENEDELPEEDYEDDEEEEFEDEDEDDEDDY
jgi:hypothetical protein